jgi:hypothetical protein
MAHAMMVVFVGVSRCCDAERDNEHRAGKNCFLHLISLFRG